MYRRLTSTTQASYQQQQTSASMQEQSMQVRHFYYSLMNADNTFAEVQAVVVDADGYMTVKQDHCSNYVVTKTEPKLPSNNDTKD